MGDAKSGFKCHISIDPWRFGQEMELLLTVLADQQAAFKIPQNLADLVRLSNGQAGVSQIGKVITVYFKNDDQAFLAVRQLDALVPKGGAPLVMGEALVSANSRVSLRYGSFHPVYVLFESQRISFDIF